MNRRFKDMRKMAYYAVAYGAFQDSVKWLFANEYYRELLDSGKRESTLSKVKLKRRLSQCR